MSAAQIQMILDAVLTLGLPWMIGIVYWLSRSLAQRLPEHQRAALVQFAHMAVCRIEQEYTNNPAKRTLAVACVEDLFQSFKLPVPPKAAILIAIEAAVYELHMSKAE